MYVTPYKTPEKQRVQQKIYYRRMLSNPDWKLKRNASTQRWNVRFPERSLLRNAKYHAKERNVPFNLELADIVIPLECPVFNVPFERCTPYAPSVDRIIPELGYVKGNIQVISRRANLMKQDASIEELKIFARWVQRTFGT